MPRKRMQIEHRVPQAIRQLLHDIARVADANKLNVSAVGGCVRDWLRGTAKTPDVDVVVEGDGIALAKQLAQHLQARLVSHEQFGTATLFLEAADRKGMP